MNSVRYDPAKTIRKPSLKPNNKQYRNYFLQTKITL